MGLMRLMVEVVKDKLLRSMGQVLQWGILPQLNEKRKKYSVYFWTFF